MPASYTIDAANRRVTAVGVGTITGAEMIALQTRMAADPAFRPDYLYLVDLSQVDGINATTQEIQHLADSTIFSPHVRRAMCVSKPVVFGLGRMFQGLGGDRTQNMSIFYDRAEAEAWLTGSGE